MGSFLILTLVGSVMGVGIVSTVMADIEEQVRDVVNEELNKFEENFDPDFLDLPDVTDPPDIPDWPVPQNASGTLSADTEGLAQAEEVVSGSDAGADDDLDLALDLARALGDPVVAEAPANSERAAPIDTGFQESALQQAFRGPAEVAENTAGGTDDPDAAARVLVQGLDTEEEILVIDVTGMPTLVTPENQEPREAGACVCVDAGADMLLFTEEETDALENLLATLPEDFEIVMVQNMRTPEPA